MQVFPRGKGITIGSALPELFVRKPKCPQALRIMKVTAIILVVASFEVHARGGSQDIALNEKDTEGNIVNIIPKGPEAADQKTLDTLPADFKTIKGRLTDKSNEAIVGATVQVKGSSKMTITNDNGEFFLENVSPHSTLIVTSVSYKPKEIKVNGRTELKQQLEIRTNDLSEVKVIASTGYQDIPKDRATGAFQVVGKELLNRLVGPDILSRLEGVTTGIQFDRTGIAASQTRIDQSNIVIRGVSTLTQGAMKAPLIVLNNFPYEGDINNINPNDILTVTILKDAAAASIWGVKAANGVIVLTTKQGQFNKLPQISFNANLNFIEKPDLFHYPKMTSSEFIDVETFLYNQGYHDGELNDNTYFPAVTSVVEILDKRRSGEISAADSATQIDALRTADVRNDFSKIFYRQSVNQQYNINVSGGGQLIKYMVSGGFDRNPSVLVGNNVNRITLYSSTTMQLTKNLDLTFRLNYNNSSSSLNSPGEIGTNAYNHSSNIQLTPYTSFTDATGAGIPTIKDYRRGYTDTAGNGLLLNWKYNPTDELHTADNTVKLQETVMNLGLSYKLFKWVQIQGSYQYQMSTVEDRSYFSSEMYFTRNLVNLYTQIQDGNATRVIPNNGILDLTNSAIKAHVGRAQVNFNRNLHDQHDIAAIAGAELSERIGSSNRDRTYGFDENYYSYSMPDYVTRYPLYGNRGTETVPFVKSLSRVTDHLVSAFANASYTFDRRYTVSGSFRRDASNLFGVELKNKWKPFWTVGTSWAISNEPFYKLSSIPYLKVRATYGYQGNVNNTISPYTIVERFSINSSLNNLPQAAILSPANPDLTWEITRQLNLALDFSLKNNRLSGAIDVFRKRSDNLLLGSVNDPASGVNSIMKNSAILSGKGIEVSLTSLNIKSPSFSWTSEFGYTYVKNKVIDYLQDDKGFTARTLAEGRGSLFVLKGYSPYAIFSYPFAGLDVSGNPQGYNGKQLSTDYLNIMNQKLDTGNFIYHGSAVPVHFGFLNNIVTFRGVSLIIGIAYNLGYYFKKSTISYYSLYNSGATHPDFSKRWQTAGDENFTTIPAMIYPLSDDRRDRFFANSSANVLKGDNVRLQTVRISYEVNRSGFKHLPFEKIGIYSMVNNLGIIWRANKEGLDPDIDSGNAPYPRLRTVAFGVNVTF